ncbi:uncharacterized protein A1O9_10414 [Exophiala aquamarina CBS 119918]|uniref:Large ribosomal subunit protein mL38 n=1 Tax=Exophiala aquamarina CBS 119918 TaxID=1182545 RepID=A0A072P001_9EURO|nr:uncharacterized protein A1O9_10414 [Exophiala aquamarina CBS 119918]KEF53439.1 hypothetical protein A1O9_10414 [Exophiala aquamarina CBS 119918]
MAPSRAPSTLLLHSLRSLTIEKPSSASGSFFRAISTSPSNLQDAEVQKTSYYRNPDPINVYVPRLERKLVRAGTRLIGSRRRRAAIAKSPGIAFDQLPYQCFQEARNILIADREEKVNKIELERSRIARLQAVDPATFPGGEAYKQKRLRSMEAELERLKILADVNDPNVKRRFEDGNGDMNKPIYRYLAERKWQEYARKVQVQRITQMNVIPDVVPAVDPILDIKVAFGRRVFPPGDYVPSRISEEPPRLTLQAFEKGDKVVTVAVVDPDVPNVETDSFDSRCHFLASNITISPTQAVFDLAKLASDTQVLLPWLPPHAQKGSPYHRLSIIVLQQKDNIPIDVAAAAKMVQRDGFSVRRFMSRHLLKPISASLFRTIWDENTATVMAKAGLGGADIELKRKKVEPLPYKRRNPSSFR